MVSVYYVVWEKSETPLLHHHGLLSPADLTFYVSTVDQPDGQMSPLTPLRMNASSLVLPASSAKEQERMLIKCINYKATL